MSEFELNVKLVDADLILKELNQLEDKLQERAIRSGLVAFAAPVKRKAKELAPTLSGDMAKAIVHRQLSKRARGRLGIAAGTVALLIGPNRKVNGKFQGRKGLWHEYGTDKMPPNEFLLPALQAESAGARGRFYQGLRKALDKR